MKVNRSKFDVAKARSCMGRKEILAAGFPDGTLRGVVSGRNLKQSEDLPKSWELMS